MALEETGERMVPEKSYLSVFWEHIYRYRFAARYVRGKEVLDIACGEGYGSAALAAAGAQKVIGVDISPETVQHAIKKYGVDARVGNAEAIPLADKSLDVVVSYETVEHVPQPAKFIEECYRVLRPDGLLIISTPNASVYHDDASPNPFHCSEMEFTKFAEVLKQRFERLTWWSQSPSKSESLGLSGMRAVESPWTRHGMLFRVRWHLRNTLAPHLFREIPDGQRQDAIRTILSSDGWAAGLLNPYAVREFDDKPSDEPMYIVAVGHRKA